MRDSGKSNLIKSLAKLNRAYVQRLERKLKAARKAQKMLERGSK